jgi:rhodanese-related sulfurtransferase
MERMSEPMDVSLARVRELAADGGQLVEVLPVEEYDEEHLPGAMSLPLKELTQERAGALDAARAVVVYCWNDT